MATIEQTIDRHFDAAKEITKILIKRSERSQIRILRYFSDVVNEKGDMQEEAEILRKVAVELGLPNLE